MKKILLLTLLFLPIFAFGDVSTNNNAQGLISIFFNNKNAWVSAIIPYAYNLFYFMIVIDWVITFSMMALKGTDFGEIMAAMINKILLIGFFLVLIQNAHWLDTIPKSFGQMATGASGINIQPDTVLEQGYKIVGKLWEGTSWFSSPGDSLGLVIAGIIILLGFIVMTAILFTVIVKLYFLITGAYFVIALMGLSYTRTMGFTAITAVFKAGLELFFVKLILGFSISVINQMAANVGTDNNSVMGMIGTSLLIAYLSTQVQGFVESLTSGTLGGNGNLAGSVKNAMQGAAQGAVGGASSAASNIQATRSAASAANLPTSTGSSSSTNSKTGKIGNFMKTTAGVAGGAVAGAVSGSVKGMVGIGTHSAGRKSGSGFVSTARGAVNTAKAIKEAPGKAGEKIADKITGNKSSSNDNTTGSISQGSISQGSDEKSSSYVSGVPSNNNSK